MTRVAVVAAAPPEQNEPMKPTNLRHRPAAMTAT
jgi:hypothetical protein